MSEINKFDVNNDGVVNQLDMNKVVEANDNFANEADSNWDNIKSADINNDGLVDGSDIAELEAELNN